MRLAALQSIVNKTLATYQVSCSHHDLLISKKSSRFSPSCRPLRHLHSVGSSSRVLYPLFRVLLCSCPLHARTHSTPSLRFCSPSRHQCKESTFGKLPSSYLVPFSVFRPPSTVYSSSHLLGLFHPKTVSKINFSRAFPAIQHYPVYHRIFPLSINEVRLL